jgi:DNA-binding beta-propeller fold protein YncE
MIKEPIVGLHNGSRGLGVGALLLIGAALAWPDQKADSPATNDEQTTPRLRRPVALALADNDKFLFVANRAAGSVTTIDVTKGRVVAETPVCHKLADMCLTSDEKQLLVVDEDKGELLMLARDGQSLKIANRVSVPSTPVSIRLAADGRHCFVASLWSRRLSVVDFAGADKRLSVKKSIDLPFAPRLQLPVANADKVIVADAFGGKLAVVDVARGIVDSVRSLPAHQIRGMAWSSDGKRLLLTHQVLHADAHTTPADIHWGNLVVNYVRSLSRDDLLSPDADLLKGSRLLPLGDVDHGTGDPAGIAVAADGTMIVALAGVAEVAIGSEKKGDWSYVRVGRRPIAVALDADGRRAFVVDNLADAVTVVDMTRQEKLIEIALGPQPELKPSERGELLFYDARRSLEGWLSCNSCHVEGHTNGLLNDNLSDGSFGTPKRVLTLLGVKDTAPWAWNGGVSELKDQVRKSLELTMRGPKPTAAEVQDLEAFLRTLLPSPPLQPVTNATKDAVGRGKELFVRLNCSDCHVPALYTSSKVYDVGLADEKDHRTFNPPSLRGVGQGGPYFHDNRAATLEDVFAVHRHQLKKELAKTDLADLLIFLRSL